MDPSSTNPYAGPNSLVEKAPGLMELSHKGRNIFLGISIGLVMIIVLTNGFRIAMVNRSDQSLQLQPFGPWHVLLWQLLIIAPIVIAAPRVGSYLGQLFQYSRTRFWFRFILSTAVLGCGLSLWSLGLEAGRVLIFENGSLAKAHLFEMSYIMAILFFIIFTIFNGIVCFTLFLSSRNRA